MKSHFRKFFSRFRKAPYDPRHTRTMAQSQLEDQQSQNHEPEEWKTFDEKSFERGQEALHNGFGTSTHSGDNPFREDDVKNHH